MALYRPGVLIANWREDQYGKDLAANRVSEPVVYKPNYETTFRTGYTAPGRDAIMKQSMTPLDVMSASLTPVSIESFASPVSLSHPVRAERPAPQVIEACANASADLSVTTREGVRKDMIFNHNDDLDTESRYQSTYQTTVSDRHAVNQPKLRTGLLEAKKKQWAQEQSQIVRESLSEAKTSSATAFQSQQHLNYVKSLTEDDCKFRSKSVITKQFTGAEFAAAKLLR